MCARLAAKKTDLILIKDRYPMTNYLLIGDGRLATHLKHYFTLLQLDFKTWSRKQHRFDAPQNKKAALENLARHADRVLLLISDREIKNFVEENPYLLQKRLIHCSGSQNFSFAESAHPLSTFGPQLYERELYVRIPFILDREGSNFSDLLPGLPNPHFRLSAEKKALYHSHCVLSGNFTTLLWQNIFENFEEKFQIPKEALYPFLECTARNLQTSSSSALTGPIARGDTETIIRHLDALASTPEQKLYYAFLNFYLEKKKKTGSFKNEYIEL